MSDDRESVVCPACEDDGSACQECHGQTDTEIVRGIDPGGMLPIDPSDLEATSAAHAAWRTL